MKSRARFLETIVPKAGYVEVRALPCRRQIFVPSDAIERIDAIAPELAAQHQNVYFGVAARRDSSSGALENCSALGSLFVDIDFKQAPEREARVRLARFLPPASVVVASGGGLHAYWLLREPLSVPDREDDLRRLLHGLATAVGGDLVAAEPATSPASPRHAELQVPAAAPRAA